MGNSHEERNIDANARQVILGKHWERKWVKMCI